MSQWNIQCGMSGELQAIPTPSIHLCKYAHIRVQIYTLSYTDSAFPWVTFTCRSLSLSGRSWGASTTEPGSLKT